MNYELAKQLKDAGFSSKTFSYSHPEVWSPPTLEELIEACPTPFQLAFYKMDWFASINWTWLNHPQARGTTPLEAVAKLWLEIQTDMNNEKTT